MNRVTGAKAFVAAARLAWLVAKDPQDPDTVLVVQLKTNITERTGWSVLSRRQGSAARAAPKSRRSSGTICR